MFSTIFNSCHFDLTFNLRGFFSIEDSCSAFHSRIQASGSQKFRRNSLLRGKTPMAPIIWHYLRSSLRLSYPIWGHCNAKITFSGHQRFGTSCHQIAKKNYSLVKCFWYSFLLLWSAKLGKQFFPIYLLIKSIYIVVID